MDVTTAVVFAGQNALDEANVRSSVLRIPEVSVKLKQAQVMLEKTTYKGSSFLNTLLLEDKSFTANLKMRSLVVAVVQVALFERWKKHNDKPNYLVGPSNSDSALQVSLGRMKFEEMIRSSALVTEKPSARTNEETESLAAAIALPILGGMHLLQYEIFILNRSTMKYESLRSQEMDLRRLFNFVFDQLPMDRLVNIGPGSSLFSNFDHLLLEKQIKITDSITCDPMLDWFWKNVAGLAQNKAN